MLSILPRFFTGCAVAVLLSGCIIVDDMSAKWDSGASAPCTDDVVALEYAKSFERAKEPPVARTFEHDGYHYLMLKSKEEDKGGHLYRFEIENGIFIGYRPDPSMRARYAEDFPDSLAQMSEDKAELPDLSDTSLDFLSKVASDQAYWVIDVKRLYNPSRNAACPLFIPVDDKDED